MPRPDFVTHEDILRWADNVDNDATTPKVYSNEPLLREVMYAGLWLGEQLKKLDCEDSLITRIQYMAGELSFGSDPWRVMQEVLDAYKNNEIEFEIDYDA